MPLGFIVPTDNEINTAGNRSSSELATNISDSSLDVLRDVARSNNMVIVTRPVNPIAFAHMKAGAVGKNMFVHGKSAPDATIAQGLIPVQSSISKAGKDNNVNKIKTYNAENAHSLSYSEEQFQEIEQNLQKIAREKRGLDPSELLKEAQIPPEAFDPLVSKVSLLDKNNNQIYIFEDPKGRALRDANRNPIYAIQVEGNFQLININHEVIDSNPIIPENFKPVAVEVIGKPEIEIGKDGSLKITKVNPITADIDVLAYGAKINLQEFDKITTHSEVVQHEKELAIADCGLALSPSLKQALARVEINKLEVPSYLAADPKFLKLQSKLKNIEVLRENLRGMGEGSDVAMAITGHMRAEFRDRVEVSHGAEQFNIHFTQPKDQEWVVIDNKGEVQIIKGEEQLLDTFNKFKNEPYGLSMPPNPNWGWRLNNGQYEIDTALSNASKECDNIRLQTNDAGYAQKTQIKEILDLQTKIGIAAITDPIDEVGFSKNKQEFLEKIEKYNKKYSQPEHNKEVQKEVEERAHRVIVEKPLIRREEALKVTKSAFVKQQIERIKANITSQNNITNSTAPTPRAKKPLIQKVLDR